MFANPDTYELWRIPVLVAWWVIPMFIWFRGLVRDSKSDLVVAPILCVAFSVLMCRGTPFSSGLEEIVAVMKWLWMASLLGLLAAVFFRPLRSAKTVRRSCILLGIGMMLAMVLPA